MSLCAMRENRAVLSAILASGVSLAAFAVYQQVSDPPPPAPVDPTVAQIFIPGADESDADLPVTADRSASASATFAQPETLAAYLVLLIPIVVVGVVLWVMAHNDLARMRARCMDPAGTEKTTTALTMGRTTVACGLLALLVLTLVAINWHFH